jgi:hypothetical protein
MFCVPSDFENGCQDRCGKETNLASRSVRFAEEVQIIWISEGVLQCEKHEAETPTLEEDFPRDDRFGGQQRFSQKCGLLQGSSVFQRQKPSNLRGMKTGLTLSGKKIIAVKEGSWAAFSGLQPGYEMIGFGFKDGSERKRFRMWNMWCLKNATVVAFKDSRIPKSRHLT